MHATELSSSQACEKLQPVMGAGAYLKAHFEALGTNPTQVSAVVGVNSSTMKRLCDGAALTIEMSAKLYKHYNLCPYDLFLLEAYRKNTRAQQLIDTGAV